MAFTAPDNASVSEFFNILLPGHNDMRDNQDEVAYSATEKNDQ